MDNQLVLYYSSIGRFKQLAIIGVAVIGLGFCSYITYNEGEILVSTAAIIFAIILLMALVVGLRKYSKSEPRFIINRTGIGAVSSKYGLIPWEDVEEITAGELRIKYSSQEYIGIRLKPQSPSAQKLNSATDEVAKELNNIFRIVRLSESGSDIRLFVSDHNVSIEDIRKHIFNLKAVYQLPIIIR
jgi:hypothetical protein